MTLAVLLVFGATASIFVVGITIFGIAYFLFEIALFFSQIPQVPHLPAIVAEGWPGLIEVRG